MNRLAAGAAYCITVAAVLAALAATRSCWGYVHLSQDNVLSFCIGDTDGDGTDDLAVLTVSGKTQYFGDKPGRYGNMLIICEAKPHSPFAAVPHGLYKVKYRYDIEYMKPLTVTTGNIRGIGREISVCVYKQAYFDPVFDKRPFFYMIEDGALLPVWLGSRLSRPFEKYELSDIDDDGIDELVALEYLENGETVLCAYSWSGFGFERIAERLPAIGKEDNNE